MSTTHNELEPIVLTKDLPDHGLKAGDVGTVVLVHRGGAGYEVEFCALNGETILVTSLEAGDLRPAGPQEVPHARAYMS